MLALSSQRVVSTQELAELLGEEGRADLSSYTAFDEPDEEQVWRPPVARGKGTHVVHVDKRPDQYTQEQTECGGQTRKTHQEKKPNYGSQLDYTLLVCECVKSSVPSYNSQV